ncbi:hypothetical protein GC163_23220 [bacterium]|nr:hypothetical protein [bacterium]
MTANQRYQKVLHSRRQSSRTSHADRRGSTLLIVLTLMGLLALLGVLFYTFSAQEQASATAFSSETRVLTAPALERDGLNDFVLKQLLLGPSDSQFNSALWGGRHSLVPNMLGRDGVPFNGTGVHVYLSNTMTGQPGVDQDYNGTADDNFLLEFNDSPSANSGTNWGTSKGFNTLPDPDVDYTYPDINHLFLSYRGMAQPATAGGSERLVIIPSFHRPAYLRNGGGTVSDWYNNSTYPARTMRPHPDHVYVGPDGNTVTVSGSAVKRFVGSADYQSLGLRKPFPFQPLNADGSTSTGAMGIWTNSSTNATAETWNLDVDLDGDGIKESILMDMDFPPQRRGDGKLMVPLFAIHLVDANGLINLNASQGTLNTNPMPTPPANSFGNNSFLKSSDLGLGPHEINPVYALSADPTTMSSSDLQQHTQFLRWMGVDPSRPPNNIQELANIERFYLTMGRPNFAIQIAQGMSSGTGLSSAITSVMRGKFGAETDGQTFFTSGAVSDLPWPAVTGLDDNHRNFTLNQNLYESPAFGLPLDYRGFTSYFNLASDSYGKTLYFWNSATANNDRWLIYNNFHTRLNTGTGAYDVQLAQSANNPYQSTLMPIGSTADHLTDDDSELISDPRVIAYAKTGTAQPQLTNAVNNDSVLAPHDTLALQLSTTDATRTATTARVLDLAPANFRAASNARDIRQRFTTLSSDRREYSLPVRRWPQSAVSTSQFLETYWDSNSDGQISSADDVTGDGLPEVFFPPRFGSSTLFDNNTDPFRNATRRLLHLDPGKVYGGNPPSNQWKLSLNHLIDISGTTLYFRRLRDHSTDTSLTALNTTETNARADRQAMARDMYVLLYLLGQPVSKNPTITALDSDPDTALALARRMAQFAVNYVDAMDPDHVISKFEFDSDLSDGWTTPINDAERTVYGIERQDLTINEALVIREPPAGGDNMRTLWNDDDMSTNSHNFVFIELKNPSPLTVNLTTSVSTSYETGIWRVELTEGPSAAQVPIDSFSFNTNSGTVNPGARYTIGSTTAVTTFSGGGNRPSDFRVDTDGDSNFELIAPAFASDTPPTSGSMATDYPTRCNLDLVDSRHANRFELENGTAPGDLLPRTNTATAINVRLWRRQNPSLPQLSITENPWIQVDQMASIPVQTFALQQTDGTAEIATNNPNNRLSNLQSQERPEPFDRINEAANNSTYSYDASMENTLRKNTLNDDNENAPSAGTGNNYWQYHLDRDLTSVDELLLIPVFGPDVTTLRIPDLKALPEDQPIATSLLGQDFSAEQNRWHRVLEFFERQPMQHRHPDALTYSRQTLAYDSNGAFTGFGTPGTSDTTNLPHHGFGVPFTQGLLNVNTIRHPQVWAGLLDDPGLLHAPPTGTLLVGKDDASRFWWYEFMAARDSYRNTTGGPTMAIDPVTNYHTPGAPGARPFRASSFNFHNGATSLRDSIFGRTLPTDDTLTNPRQLLEVGTSVEHQNAQYESLIKNRLLKKLPNSTTTRSNTFVVYVGVQFFEAAAVTGNNKTAYRIGGRLEDTPEYRSVFLIDRSGVVDQVRWLIKNGSTISTIRSSSTFSYTEDTSNSPASPNGIRWEDLVIDRQTLN